MNVEDDRLCVGRLLRAPDGPNSGSFGKASRGESLCLLVGGGHQSRVATDEDISCAKISGKAPNL